VPRLPLPLAGLFVWAALVVGCGSSSSSAPSSDQVSFKGQVLPILEMNCGTSACHGVTGNAMAVNLYLGGADDLSEATVNAVYENLVGAKAVEDPAMNLVTEGDTSQSYVTYKLENTQGKLAADCAKATMMCIDCDDTEPCGTSMLYLQPVFAMSNPDDFATLEAWITQGAKNN
jgi:hypothetical protein